MTATRKYTALLDRATDAQRAAGINWYPRAHALARSLSRRYAAPLERSAGVLAAISPRLTWARNIELAHAILAGTYHQGCLKANYTKAVRILDGESPDIVLGGPKVRAFYTCLLGQSAVVIDVHMANAAGVDRVTEKSYSALSKACAKAAATRNLQPHEAQAVIWTVQRGTHL